VSKSLFIQRMVFQQMSEHEGGVEADKIHLLTKERSNTRPWILVGCLIAVVAAISYLGLIIWGGLASLDAERNLQSTLFVIQLVDKFVIENKRWPASWVELQSCKPPEKLAMGDVSLMFGPWPESADEVKKRVVVDFQPDLRKVAHQDVIEFESIKPDGRHYPYRDYGFIQQLQKSMRNCIQISAK